MLPRSTSPLGFRLIVGAFFLLGLGLVVGALVNAGSTVRLLRASWVADGKIIWMDRVHRVHRSGYVYMPVFRFVMENGQTFMLRSNKGSNPPAFKVGDAVKVYYKPDHPELAVINTFEQLWAADTGLACVGLIVMGMGALMLRGRGLARLKYRAVVNDPPKSPEQA
jgi:Protein of unknown function (DUF3592)